MSSSNQLDGKRKYLAGAESSVREIFIPFVVFVLVFGTLAITSSRRQSPTFDEPIHLLGGYSYLKWNDYRINPEHPPLVKLWAALPLVSLDINDPRPFTPYWELVLKAEPGGSFHPLTREMFFVRNDADRLFFAAKLQMLALSIVLASFICLWSHQLYGTKAAVISLFLFGLDPNILAHSTIIHSDLPFALWFFLSSYFFWRTLKHFSWFNTALAVVAVALAAVTKHSFVAIFLAWAVLGLLDLWSANASRTKFEVKLLSANARRKIGRLSFLFGAAVLASYGAVWAVYGFRFNAVPESGRALYMTQISPPYSPSMETIRSFVLEHRLLPEAMVAGYSYNLKIWKHAAYLLGEISQAGFWSYFPVAFAVKTPAPTLLLLVGTAVSGLRKGAPRICNRWLVIPALIYFGLAVFSRFNIGIRHLLPVYPFLFVLLSGTAALLWQTHARVVQIGLLILVLWYAGASASIYPHYLSYFNEFVGGAKNGHKILLDSNLDWGQDLKALKSWMDRNGVRTIQLLYFGGSYPEYYGVKDLYSRANVERHSFPPGEDLELPEHLAVSATFFYAPDLYMPREMSQLLRSFKLGSPLATVGYSILIFKIDRRNALTYDNAAYLMARKGGLAAAANLYRQALKIDSRRRTSHFNLANVLAQQEDFTEAARHYQEVLKIDPGFAEAHEGFGRLLALKGDDSRAIEEFREALRLQPAFAEAHESLSRIYKKQGKIKEAIEHAEAAVKVLKALPGDSPAR